MSVPARSLALVLALALASLLVGRVALASPVEAIAGWEGESFREAYAFGSVGVVAGSGGVLSAPIRATGSYLTYRYDDVAGETRVRAPGVALTAGPRASGRHGSVTLVGGAELRWERRARAVAGTWGPVVARAGGVVEGTADLRLGRRFIPFLLATYSGSARYLFGRAALRFQCSNLDWSGPTTWNAGIEVTAQGNSDTNALQLGGQVECALPRARLTLSVHGGLKSTDAGGAARRRSGYVGAGLYRRF
ncbi:MAG: cellulose biosynthesis protein BcsS [Hyphomicrobiales bacterium]